MSSASSVTTSARRHPATSRAAARPEPSSPSFAPGSHWAHLLGSVGSRNQNRRAGGGAADAAGAGGAGGAAGTVSAKTHQAAVDGFRALTARIGEFEPVRLYDAVEEGVPTVLVSLMASAFSTTTARMLSLLDISETTFRRKEEANEPFPAVAGHRVMGLLRVASALRRLLKESGDPKEVESFDLEGWVSEWIAQPQPELGGRPPAELLRNPEGQRVVEQLLERMRGGLPA